MELRYTFKKEERISSQKEIDLLFNEGTSFVSYPLRIIFIEKKAPSVTPSSVLVNVSKKRFKRAVKRNQIKRLIRESYRLNKHSLLGFLSEKNKELLIAFLYISNEVSSYKEIEKAMVKAIGTLKEKLS